LIFRTVLVAASVFLALLLFEIGFRINSMIHDARLHAAIGGIRNPEPVRDGAEVGLAQGVVLLSIPALISVSFMALAKKAAAVKLGAWVLFSLAWFYYPYYVFFRMDRSPMIKGVFPPCCWLLSRNSPLWATPRFWVESSAISSKSPAS